MNLQRRRTDHSTHTFETTTGRGPAKVTVGYEIDSDGDAFDIVVHMECGADITATLDDDAFDAITDECYANYEADCKSHNDDLKIAAAESNTPYYYNDRI